MAEGWGVVVNRDEVALPVHANNGRALLYYQRQVDELAESLGVTPLSRFFSRSPEDIAEFLRRQGVEPDPDDLPDEQWFEPAEGLAVVRALLSALNQSPEVLSAQAGIVADLVAAEESLKFAAAHECLFHLGRKLPKLDAPPEREWHGR